MPDFPGTLKTPRLASAPGSPVAGQMYYDTGTNLLRWWNGTAWTTAADAGADATKVDKDSVVVAATRIVASKLLVGDTQPAFQLNGDGKLNWGPGGTTAVDTNLYRSSANALTTGGDFNAQRLIGLRTAGGEALRLGLLADTYARLSVTSDGAMSWGPGGTTPPDTNLYRSLAAVLKTDGSLLAALDLAASRSVYVDNGGTGAKLMFGSAADANLYRGGAGQIKTDGQFLAGMSASGGTAFMCDALASNGYIVAAKQTGDTGWRMLWDRNGSFSWGPGGSASADTNLYRNGFAQLYTDSDFWINGYNTNATPSSTGLVLNFGTIGFRRIYCGAVDSAGSGYRLVVIVN